MSRSRRKSGLIMGAGMVLLSFGYLVYGGIGNNLVYFVTPTELLARGDQAYDAPVRLGGMVKPGTVDWNADELDLRFDLQDEEGDGYVRVHSRGAPPQMFRDGMGVVVEGRFTEAHIFESTNLMVMHSNEYRAEEDSPKAGELYHQLPRR